MRKQTTRKHQTADNTSTNNHVAMSCTLYKLLAVNSCLDCRDIWIKAPWYEHKRTGEPTYQGDNWVIGGGVGMRKNIVNSIWKSNPPPPYQHNIYHNVPKRKKADFIEPKMDFNEILDSFKRFN